MTIISKSFVKICLTITVVIVLSLAIVVFFSNKVKVQKSRHNSSDATQTVESVEFRAETLREAKTLRKGNHSSLDDILKLKRYEMERYGAIGSAVLRVKDGSTANCRKRLKAGVRQAPRPRQRLMARATLGPPAVVTAARTGISPLLTSSLRGRICGGAGSGSRGSRMTFQGGPVSSC